MKKLVTEKQLEANRRNAQLSTGPKTDSGKAISRFNAVKHNLLASQAVACGRLYQEPADEFKKLSREYHQSLSPAGPLEEMLVGQIVTTVWRLRRVRMAESGEVAMNVDRNWFNPRRTPWEMGNGFKRNALYGSLDHYAQTVKGIKFVIECIQELRQAIEKAGELTERKLKEHQYSCSKPNEIIEALMEMYNEAQSNPENLPLEQLRTQQLKKMLDYLDGQIGVFENLTIYCQEIMDAEDRIRRAAAMLPEEPVMEKIVRYESALQRQLYRSMNQLERLQRRRLGENIPPPVVMDVSVRA